MARGGHIGELVRALAVLALVFFNFAHAPAAAPASVAGWPDLAFGSLCGELPDRGAGNDEPAHAPCHACRIGAGADLPRVPACPALVPVARAVQYDTVVFSPTTAFAHAWPAARGPPSRI